MEGETLFRRYLSGEKGAFDEIVSLYRENLIFFINRYTHDLDAAEDLSQDVFLVLLMAPRKYDFRVKLKTYLFTIARNKALNYMKKHKRETLMGDDLSEKSEEYAAFESEMFRRDERRALFQAIERLKPDYAEVLHLLYFEEMSYLEAGGGMKKSQKQIENLAMRARQALRAIMTKEGYVR